MTARIQAKLFKTLDLKHFKHIFLEGVTKKKREKRAFEKFNKQPVLSMSSRRFLVVCLCCRHWRVGVWGIFVKIVVHNFYLAYQKASVGSCLTFLC